MDHFAFCQSNTETISISPQITQICEGSFSGCINLKHVEIQQNSNLQNYWQKCIQKLRHFSFFLKLLRTSFYFKMLKSRKI